MKKIIFGMLLAAFAAAAVFAAAPYYTTYEQWCPSVTESTSTFVLADNVYVKDINLVNLSTGAITFAVKAASTAPQYFVVETNDSKRIEVNEKLAALNVSINMTHVGVSSVSAAFPWWTPACSSVNVIGVLYRYR